MTRTDAKLIRDHLESLKGWIKHWETDRFCNLVPTESKRRKRRDGRALQLARRPPSPHSAIPLLGHLFGWAGREAFAMSARLSQVPGTPPPSSAELKVLLRQSVILAALENLMKLDTDPVLRAAARARYLDLTDGRLPQ